MKTKKQIFEECLNKDLSYSDTAMEAMDIYAKQVFEAAQVYYDGWNYETYEDYKNEIEGIDK